MSHIYTMANRHAESNQAGESTLLISELYRYGEIVKERD